MAPPTAEQLASVSCLPHVLQEGSESARLVMGPLPQGTTSAQMIVEVLQESGVLEVFLQGSSLAPLRISLPPGVTGKDLQASFSKKHARLSVSWPTSVASKPAEGQAMVAEPSPPSTDTIEALHGKVPSEGRNAEGVGRQLEQGAAVDVDTDVVNGGQDVRGEPNSTERDAAEGGAAIPAEIPAEKPAQAKKKKKKNKKKSSAQGDAAGNAPVEVEPQQAVVAAEVAERAGAEEAAVSSNAEGENQEVASGGGSEGAGGGGMGSQRRKKKKQKASGQGSTCGAAPAGPMESKETSGHTSEEVLMPSAPLHRPLRSPQQAPRDADQPADAHQPAASNDDKFSSPLPSAAPQHELPPPSAPQADLPTSAPSDAMAAGSECLNGLFIRNHLGKAVQKGEDTWLLQPNLSWLDASSGSEAPFSVFGLFDGHGGKGAANYASKNLLKHVLAALDDAAAKPAAPLDAVDMSEQLLSHTAPADRGLWLAQDCMVAALPAAMCAGFESTDADFKKRSKTSGATATLAMIVGWELVVGNVGDSWAFLDTGAEVIQVCGNHRLDDSAEERKRLIALGCEVAQSTCREEGTGVGPLRVWPGGLAMSRTLGDYEAGDAVTALPEIRQVTLPSSGGRLVLASDGLWDALNPKTAMHSVRGMNAGQAAHHLELSALKARGLRDDITVVVVDLLPSKDCKSPPLLSGHRRQPTPISLSPTSPFSFEISGVDPVHPWKPQEGSSAWRRRVYLRREWVVEHLVPPGYDDPALAGEEPGEEDPKEEVEEEEEEEEEEMQEEEGGTGLSDTYMELANLRIDPATIGQVDEDEWETVPSKAAQQEAASFAKFAIPGLGQRPVADGTAGGRGQERGRGRGRGRGARGRGRGRSEARPAGDVDGAGERRAGGRRNPNGTEPPAAGAPAKVLVVPVAPSGAAGHEQPGGGRPPRRGRGRGARGRGRGDAPRGEGREERPRRDGEARRVDGDAPQRGRGRSGGGGRGGRQGRGRGGAGRGPGAPTATHQHHPGAPSPSMPIGA
eukprot:jgi/Tetstr1/441914/TSEL_030121.t2